MTISQLKEKATASELTLIETVESILEEKNKTINDNNGRYKKALDYFFSHAKDFPSIAQRIKMILSEQDA